MEKKSSLSDRLRFASSSSRIDDDDMAKARNIFLSNLDQHRLIVDSVLKGTINEHELLNPPKLKYVYKSGNEYRYTPRYGRGVLNLLGTDEVQDIVASDLSELLKIITDIIAATKARDPLVENALKKELDKKRKGAKKTKTTAATVSPPEPENLAEEKSEVSKTGESSLVDDTSKLADPSKTRAKARH